MKGNSSKDSCKEKVILNQKKNPIETNFFKAKESSNLETFTKETFIETSCMVKENSFKKTEIVM